MSRRGAGEQTGVDRRGDGVGGWPGRPVARFLTCTCSTLTCNTSHVNLGRAGSGLLCGEGMAGTLGNVRPRHCLALLPRRLRACCDPDSATARFVGASWCLPKLGKCIVQQAAEGAENVLAAETVTRAPRPGFGGRHVLPVPSAPCPPHALGHFWPGRPFPGAGREQEAGRWF